MPLVRGMERTSEVVEEEGGFGRSHAWGIRERCSARFFVAIVSHGVAIVRFLCNWDRKRIVERR